MSNSGLTYRRRSLTALLTALAMIFTFSLGVLAQNFSDVDENANYNEAVNWLTEIDVFTGYPDGTFRPEDDLSREEFAAVVVRALNKESASDALDNQATPFSDNSSIDWSRGYVVYSVGKNIINGYPDNTFRPQGQVTYAEAFKMLIMALGLGDEVNWSQGWPTNAITLAHDIGLNDGISGISADNPMSRGDLALATWNAVQSRHDYDGSGNLQPNLRPQSLLEEHWPDVAAEVGLSKTTGEFAQWRSGERIELAGNNVYELASGAEVSYNRGPATSLTAAEKSKFSDGDTVTLTFNEDDEVELVELFRHDVEGLLEAVTVTANETEYGSITVAGQQLTVDPDTALKVDGQLQTVQQLADLDVVDTAYVRVQSRNFGQSYAVEALATINTVAGKVENKGADSQGPFVVLKVDGGDEKYTVVDSTLAGTIVVGSQVTLILNHEDVVVGVDDDLLGLDRVHVRLLSYTGSNASSPATATFEKPDGSSVTLTFGSAAPDYAWNASPAAVDEVYAIDTQALPQPAVVNAAAQAALLDQTGANFINVQPGGTKTLAGDTLVKIGDEFKTVADLKNQSRIRYGQNQQGTVQLVDYIEAVAPTLTGPSANVAGSDVTVNFHSDAGGTFTVRYQAQGASSWTTGGDGNASTPGSSNVTFAAPAASGTYDVEIVFTDGHGLQGTATTTFTIP